MKAYNKTALPLIMGAAIACAAPMANAADLEFYFPVGVNAPAVATIEELTNAWAAQNPQHTVKAVYAGNYEETTTKALTAAQAGDPPQVAVLLQMTQPALDRRRRAQPHGLHHLADRRAVALGADVGGQPVIELLLGGGELLLAAVEGLGAGPGHGRGVADTDVPPRGDFV